MRLMPWAAQPTGGPGCSHVGWSPLTSRDARFLVAFRCRGVAKKIEPWSLRSQSGLTKRLGMASRRFFFMWRGPPNLHLTCPGLVSLASWRAPARPKTKKNRVGKGMATNAWERYGNIDAKRYGNKDAKKVWQQCCQKGMATFADKGMATRTPITATLEETFFGTRPYIYIYTYIQTSAAL